MDNHFMNKISQNIHWMDKRFQPYSFSQTIQQTLPPSGRKQMETHQMPRNGPKQLSIPYHRNGNPQIKKLQKQSV